MINSGSTWYAADLERYNSEYRVQLLSIHKEALNFSVESWPHLLFLVKTGFEKGPCTVGLEPDLFAALKQAAESAAEIRFNSHALILDAGDSRYLVNWREGEKLSFAPFKIDNIEHGKASTAVKSYSRALENIDLNTPSAVLLGMTGGAEYFRVIINNIYPEIIKYLLLKNEQEFMNGCRKIIGMGHGSSPGGDDLICGALLAYHHFIADQLFIDNISAELKTEAGKTSLMGGHMLEIGRSGLTPDVFKALLISIIRGSFNPELLTRALQIGSSTGIDLITALITFTNSYLCFLENDKVI